MNTKKLFVEFVTVFAVALMTTAIVTLLWNIIGHGTGAVDWETAFRFAIIFGTIFTWAKAREIKGWQTSSIAFKKGDGNENVTKI